MDTRNPKQRVIEKHWGHLVRDLQPRKLLRHLRDCFDQDDVDVVKAQETEQAQAERLLEMLPKKDAFERFFTALEKTQPHLAKMLNDELANEEKEDVNNLLKQERSHSADLQEKLDVLQKKTDAVEKENRVLLGKIEKQASKPSKDTADLLLQHFARLSRSTEQLLPETKQTRNTGDRTQVCSVCKDIQHGTGEILSEEIRKGLEDAHRINNLLVTVKKLIKMQEKKVAAALQENDNYRTSHAGRITKLNDQIRALEKQLHGKTKQNEKEQEKIKEEAFEKIRKLQVQLDELQQRNNRLEADNRKSQEQLSNLRKERQKTSSLHTKREERVLSREDSRSRSELKEHKVRLRELSAENKTLASKHETLAGEHETLADKHETLVGEHETLAGEHKVLRERVELLEKEKARTKIVKKIETRPCEIETEHFKSTISYSETINVPAKNRSRNGQVSFMHESRSQTGSSAVQGRKVTTPRIAENTSKYSTTLRIHREGGRARICSRDGKTYVIRVGDVRTDRWHRTQGEGLTKQQTNHLPSIVVT